MRDCARCGAFGPWARQARPWGLYGVCDFCWIRLRGNAWRLYRAARRAGTLWLPEHCSGPGCRRLAEVGHHRDYRRPFAVLWLCKPCHRKAHQVTGRCAGCGKTGPPKPLSRHVTECGAWLALPPGRQLGPEQEYRRWESEDKGGERDARRDRAIADNTAARAASSARFARGSDLDAILDGLEAG